MQRIPDVAPHAGALGQQPHELDADVSEDVLSELVRTLLRLEELGALLSADVRLGAVCGPQDEV